MKLLSYETGMVESDTHFQQYGRHPRHVKKYGPRFGGRQDRPVRQPFTRSFEESRRRNECHKCGDRWHAVHRCAPGSIRQHIRSRLNKGESSVHIISELVHGLEGELDSDPAGNAPQSEPEDDGNVLEEGSDTDVRFASVRQFDELDDGEEVTRDIAENADRVSAGFLRRRRSQKLRLRRRKKIRKHSVYRNRKKKWKDVDCTDIYILKLASATRRERPLGFCVDIGAPRSVIGLKELHRITTRLGFRKPKSRRSYNRFRFADTTFESLGQIELPLDTPSHVRPVSVLLDIVRADVPALLGMDLLDCESLTPDTVANRLSKRVAVEGTNGEQVYLEEWYVPLMRSESNHVYVGISSSPAMYFERSQLVKLQRNFFHPSAEKLFNLLKRARPEQATPGTMRVLQDISKRCDPCQRIQNAPTRFKVAFGAENARFNERLLLDIMYIDGKPILHIVDEGTRFSVARFLPDVSTKTVWRALLECWALIYTGLPNRMLVDQGTSFGKSEGGGLFVDLAALANVTVEKTGVEAHSSLGLGERYYQPLRQTYRKIMSAHPDTLANLALSSAVKAMNDTLGPEGLVPSMLVFGECPKVVTRSERNPPRRTLRQRAELAETARKEMEQHMARMRLSRALKQAVPSATDEIYEEEDKVLVWREKIVDNRIGEWIGPFKIVDFDAGRKLVFVRDADVGPARPFNITQVKRYQQPEMVAHTFMSSLDESLSYYRTPPDNDDIYLTEIIEPTDTRAASKEMIEAKRAEIRTSWTEGHSK